MAAKFHKLETDYQSLLAEHNLLKCKLECKTEALLILSHEMEQYRSERDQYKLMADQLRERYSALKKRVEGWGPSLLGVYDMRGFKGEREQSLVQLLCELKEQNKSLQSEVDDLKQKLTDAHGDIRILREQTTRCRRESSDEELSPKQFSHEREGLVKHLEVVRHKCLLLERDLQALFDEKEELVTARDAYRHKFERLNQQLNCILRGDQHTTVDIDGVLMENRYLQERIKQVQEENAMISSALMKCKAMLEKKRSRGSQRFSALSVGLALSAKQVEQLLQNSPFLDVANKSTNSTDVQNLIMTLLEALSDKTLALSHQKKTNKILGNRVSELEQKIRNMEAATLWNLQDEGRLSYLLRATRSEDSQSLENISPQHLVSSPCGIPIIQDASSPVSSETVTSEDILAFNADEPSSPSGKSKRASSSFSDLDLLPTKECSQNGGHPSRSISVNSCASNLSDSQNSNVSSPYHRMCNVHHNDSEISSVHTLLSNSSSRGVCKNTTCDISGESCHLDIDDLPPKLQKLLVAALAEIENQAADSSKSHPSSPVHHPPVKDADPSC